MLVRRRVLVLPQETRSIRRRPVRRRPYSIGDFMPRPSALSVATAAAAEWPRTRTRPRAPALTLRRPGEQALLTGLALLAYLSAAVFVVLLEHSIIGDAWSRVGNAYYVLFSRDPHLAAVGFVWNPLPSLSVIPLLPFKAFWPDLVATGFAGSIVSALCMAGAVWQIYGIALDWQVRRSARLIVTFLFALNPMIVYYGANAMSEAMFLLTLLVATRYLARWAREGREVSLVVAGLALAAAYLTRYEAVVAAIGGVAVVILISAARRSGDLRDRLAEAVADAAVFAAPFVMVFAAWAVASWLIVGDPFQQFTSVYGVVSQLAVAQSAVASVTGQGTPSAYAWVVRQVFGLEPGIVVLGLYALVVTFRGRSGLTLPAMGMVGAVVAFAVFGFLTGRTLGWLRYSIAVIPLATILALAVLAPSPRKSLWPQPLRGPRQEARATRIRIIVDRVLGVASVGFLALAIPFGAATMLSPGSNPQYGGEAFQLRPILFPSEPAGQYSPFGQYEVGRQAATYLDALHLGNGAVLVDGAMGFPVILESDNPTQFITTSDRDFQEALLDPVSFKVSYLLVPEDIGYQSLDALNRAYPGIYENGAGIGPLAAEFSAGGNTWRLYQVTP
jgi:hypothetical protein